MLLTLVSVEDLNLRKRFDVGDVESPLSEGLYCGIVVHWLYGEKVTEESELGSGESVDGILLVFLTVVGRADPVVQDDQGTSITTVGRSRSQLSVVRRGGNCTDLEGETAVRAAESKLFGPSLLKELEGRMLPTTTTGLPQLTVISKRKADSSNVSEP